jgi:O-acetylhomoserine (thiol)-lyase
MTLDTTKLGFNTRALHAGTPPDPTTGARQFPIHQATAFVFKDAEHGADMFALRSMDFSYSRMTNPTVDALQKRIAQLEGGVGATCVASGIAAHQVALLPLMAPGLEFIASSRIYGGTVNQFSNTFRERFGWTCRFVDINNLDEVKAAINDKTRAIFMESISNPGGVVADIEAVAKIANEAGIPLIVDNTIPSPALCRPFEWGAHIVTHSTTKYLSGHGNAMGGAVVDSGKFDWSKYADKFPALAAPNASYDNLNFSEKFGEMAYTVYGHVVGLRDVGPCQAPLNAFLTLAGIETLSLRMERHSESALAVAKFLKNHPAVAWVSFSGLEDSQYAPLVKKYMHKGYASSVFTFGVKGGYAEGKTFAESLQLFSFLANIGDTRSLVIHPASTTHSQVPPETRKKIGLGEETIRLSIGLEDLEDIIADLDQALNKAIKTKAA